MFQPGVLYHVVQDRISSLSGRTRLGAAFPCDSFWHEIVKPLVILTPKGSICYYLHIFFPSVMFHSSASVRHKNSSSRRVSHMIVPHPCSGTVLTVVGCVWFRPRVGARKVLASLSVSKKKKKNRVPALCMWCTKSCKCIKRTSPQLFSQQVAPLLNLRSGAFPVAALFLAESAA